jgi:membrane peptidoglycan carboxypeptidase
VAYSTLANHGVRREPRTISSVRQGGDADPQSGELVYRAPATKSTRVMSAATADEVVDVLKGVVERGTGTRAQQSFTVFGKTGTTNDSTDAWFIGCTPKLCIATWMGYDRPYKKNGKPNSMRGVEGVRQVYGGTLPAQIFATTWDKYEQYQAERANPEQQVKSSPTPKRQRTSSPKPRKTKLPSARPSPTRVTPTPAPTTPGPTKTKCLPGPFCESPGPQPEQTAPP